MAKDDIQVTEGSIYQVIHDDPKIAADMTAKADLVREIIAIKDGRGLTQSQLGAVIGMNQADVSRMLRGNFRNIAIGKIMECLTSLNRDVRIVINRHPVEGEPGTIGVMVGG